MLWKLQANKRYCDNSFEVQNFFYDITSTQDRENADIWAKMLEKEGFEVLFIPGDGVAYPYAPNTMSYCLH